MSQAGPRIAVLLPCYNEEAAIAQTVAGFRAAFPDAAIYVYDNNSRDRTAEVARSAGAIVRTERMQGKGNVVRRMFADVDADLYVMADGDATYDAAVAPAMVARLIDEGLDMVVGARVHEAAEAYRRGHVLGNRVMTGILARLFGRSFTDIFSGYRVFSRRFVKSFPVLSAGFEIETEISVHALELKMPVGEVEARYFARPEGSQSKLSTYGDGARIARTILTLYRIERPLLFFGMLAAAFALVAVVLAVPLVVTYFQTGLVPRLPTAILATGLMILAFLNFFTGLILDTVVRGRREVRRLAYLAVPGPLAGQGAARPTACPSPRTCSGGHGAAGAGPPVAGPSRAGKWTPEQVRGNEGVRKNPNFGQPAPSIPLLRRHPLPLGPARQVKTRAPVAAIGAQRHAPTRRHRQRFGFRTEPRLSPTHTQFRPHADPRNPLSYTRRFCHKAAMRGTRSARFPHVASARLALRRSRLARALRCDLIVTFGAFPWLRPSPLAPRKPSADVWAGHNSNERDTPPCIPIPAR